MQTDFIQIDNPDENAAVLKMITRYIRDGRDPVKTIRDGILRALQ